MSAIVIRKAAWVVAWDDAHGHVYRQGIDVAFSDDRIVHVGAHFEGEAAREIDGSDRLVMPGFINIHSHPASEPLRKGVTDETRSPGFHHSSLYEFLPVLENDREGCIASLRVALSELLLSGCTTITDLSSPYEGWLDVLADSGIRAVVAPGFRDARWATRDGHSLTYEWNEAAGREGFERAQALIERMKLHPSPRLSAMVYPAQVDTCTEARLRESYELALEHDLPWQTHAAQSVAEFQEMHRRHGKTPVQWLASIGVLGENTILGHAIFLDHHPWLHWTTRRDLDLLRDSGTSVAHCPTVFARRGIALRTLGGYRRHGINIGIGTDTYPHNIVEEMRAALHYARVIAETVDDLATSDVFNAATIGGAKALRRDDIGRLAPGSKADLVLVDVTHPSMRPLREPIRSLLYVAAERPITDVFVDGNQVVADRQIRTIDHAAACAELEAAQQRSLSRTSQLDWARRTADQMSPMVFHVDA